MGLGRIYYDIFQNKIRKVRITHENKHFIINKTLNTN